MAKPPTDAFMGMLDLAWQDFRTYREAGDDSKPMGIAVILIGSDPDGAMTLKSAANIAPDIVEAALVSLTLGFATGTMECQKMPAIRRKRVV